MVPWIASIALSTRASASDGSSRDELAHVLEREADRVEALDDAVVQVLSDPFAFGHHGHPFELGVQPGVADGDPRIPRERLDDPHVVLGEVLAALLLGQVEVADRAALDANRRSQERVHRRMGRREAGTPVVGHHVVDADRAVFLDQQSEQAMAARQRSDRAPRLIGHPAGDELLDHAVVAERAERRVLGADERSNEIDDQLQQSFASSGSAVSAMVAVSSASSRDASVATSTSAVPASSAARPHRRCHGSDVSRAIRRQPSSASHVTNGPREWAARHRWTGRGRDHDPQHDGDSLRAHRPTPRRWSRLQRACHARSKRSCWQATSAARRPRQPTSPSSWRHEWVRGC